METGLMDSKSLVLWVLMLLCLCLDGALIPSLNTLKTNSTSRGSNSSSSTTTLNDTEGSPIPPLLPCTSSNLTQCNETAMRSDNGSVGQVITEAASKVTQAPSESDSASGLLTPKTTIVTTDNGTLSQGNSSTQRQNTDNISHSATTPTPPPMLYLYFNLTGLRWDEEEEEEEEKSNSPIEALNDTVFAYNTPSPPHSTENLTLPQKTTNISKSTEEYPPLPLDSNLPTHHHQQDTPLSTNTADDPIQTHPLNTTKLATIDNKQGSTGGTYHHESEDTPPNGHREADNHLMRSRPMSNHLSHGRVYAPHAIHGLIWEERHYMLSVLVPIGCGVMGAVLIVCVAYGLRNCNTDNSSQTNHLAAIKRRVHQPQAVRHLSCRRTRMDQVLLLADSSDDELDRR